MIALPFSVAVCG